MFVFFLFVPLVSLILINVWTIMIKLIYRIGDLSTCNPILSNFVSIPIYKMITKKRARIEVWLNFRPLIHKAERYTTGLTKAS